MKEKKKEFICFYRRDVACSLTWDAERGDVEAQAALGRLYFEGRREETTTQDTGHDVIVTSFTPPFEANLAMAAAWLQKAARQGHAEAKRLLTTVLSHAEGVH